jgi:hypothetical protein
MYNSFVQMLFITSLDELTAFNLYYSILAVPVPVAAYSSEAKSQKSDPNL